MVWMTDVVLDSEQQVLGAVLSDAKAIDAVRELVKPNDFHDGRHRLIFAAVCAVADAGKPVDAVTVADALGDGLERAGGHVALQELVQSVVTTGNADWHAERVADAARGRTMGEAVERFQRTGDTTALRGALDAVPGTTAGEGHSGQVRFAYRLAARFTGSLLHVHGIGWHHWTGKRWEVDHGDAAAQRAVLVILRDALAESLHDKQLRTDVKVCESAAGIRGVLQIASALVEFAATVRDMDADPHLLNCANGTLDLRTRQVRPHDPADRLSRITEAAYDPDADGSVWSRFLASVLPDDDERAYLQRVIGQGVAGLVREHLFPVLIGEGANGKGTAYGAVCFALGDYATVIDPDILMVKDRGGVGGPEMMTLRGARLVVGSETDEGRKLDEALMKRLTGGDELTARNLYQPPVTWAPTHQLVYVTNHEPRVKGNDAATWRRVRVIPFEVVVPESERDPDLPERLRLHADAVLAWAVAGYFDYLDRGGMREPETVLRATNGYQQRSDPVARFVADDEYVTRGAGAHGTTRELYAAWQRFAIADGAEAISEKAFAGELQRLGYDKRHTKIGAVWAGLGAVSNPVGDGW